MYLGFEDLIRLMHPAIAVLFVFPLIGIVLRMAWQTRQRRLQIAAGGKSKIPPVVGQEHVNIGRWLAGAVVGIELLGITQPMVKYLLGQMKYGFPAEKQLWNSDPFKLVLIGLLYVATISSLVMLYRAVPRIWRIIFAGLTGVGVVLLSFQDVAILQQEVIYRRKEELLLSHFYLGVIVTLLMIFSLAIIQDIYQDRANRWRTVHIVLNCFALLLFVGQGITGTRDLLEIPLSWQESVVYGCNFDSKSPGFKTCPPLVPPK